MEDTYTALALFHSTRDPQGVSTGTFDKGHVTQQQESGGFVVFAITIEAILMVLICVTNGTVLVAFVRTPGLRTITNYYIVQMAVADLSVGLWMSMHMAMFVLPHVLVENISLCTLRYASLLLSLGGSITSLLAMTYDRLSAILHPLHYHGNMTMRRYILSALCVWAWPVTMATVSMAWHNEWSDVAVLVCDMVIVLPKEYLRYFLLPQFLAITAVMVAMYFVILRVAHHRAVSEPPQVPPTGRQPDPPSRLRRDMKMIKTGLIVFCCFYCCWLPLPVLLLLQVMHTPVLLSPILSSVRTASVFLALLHSALNPLVYAFRLPLYRAHFYKLLPCRGTRVGVMAAQLTDT